jgi:hypothetical protein
MWFYKVLAAQDVRDGLPKRARMPSEYYGHWDELKAIELENAKDALRSDSDEDLRYNDDSAPEG